MTAPGAAPPKYRPDVDGLRAVAVLSVVAFHTFPGGLPGGFTGVDVFFVISGFLISRIIIEDLEGDAFRFRGFYARRARRIFPALALVLAASSAIGWHALLADEYRQLGKHVAGGAGFASNLVLWSEAGYFDGAAGTKPLLHLWSLGIEEQFYVFFPLLLWASWKRGVDLLAATGVVAIGSFVASLGSVGAAPVAAFYSPLTRCWELMCGAILAQVGSRAAGGLATTAGRIVRSAVQRADGAAGRGPSAIGGTRCADVASTLGIAVLGYGFLRIDPGLRFPGAWALVPVAGSVLVIAAGPGAWLNRRILSNRVLVWIGLISFPLYLWHWVLLSFARIMEGAIPSVAVRVTLVAASVGLAWLTFVAIERPIRRGAGARAVVPVVSALLALLGAFGYFTSESAGFPFRDAVRRDEALKEQFRSDQDLGKPAGARIMLLGDSHAAHLIPGLKASFPGEVADHTSPGCIPFDGVDRYDSRFARGGCADAMSSALERLERDGKMRGVILASMGPVYLSGEAFNGVGTERVTGDGVELVGHPEVTDRWDVYATGMRRTLDRLTRSKKRVLFVIDVPELGFEPRSCFDARPLVLLSRRRSPCAVPRAEYDARSGRYKTLVSSVLQEFPEVLVYDPTEDFCDDRLCWAARGGRALYKDIDHLSDEGSRFLVDRMRPVIEQLR